MEESRPIFFCKRFSYNENALYTIIVKVAGFVTPSLARSLGDRIRSYPTLSVVSAF